jgi:hypothetical protein
MAASKRLRYEILKRDKHECQYCGGKAPDVQLTVDHVVPVTLGGTDDPSNLVAACKDCNAGKSSVPADAPLVAGVADKALAWAEAMRIVAEERAAARASSEKLYAKFRKEWNSWKDWRGNTTPLDAGWKGTIDQLLNAGLDMQDVLEMVDVAMAAKAKDTWRYFCGCCWKQLSKMQERATQILAAPDVVELKPNPFPDDPVGWPKGVYPTPIPTCWSLEEIDDVYRGALDALKERFGDDHRGYMGCEHTGDSTLCGDLLCKLFSSAINLGFLHHDDKEARISG